MQRLLLAAVVLVGPTIAGAANAPHHSADAPLCELPPIDFPSPSFARAIKYFLGTDTPLDQDVELSGATFTFGPPHRVPDVEHKVVDMTMTMTFDASNVITKWMKLVKAQEDVGCSSRTVWFPNPTWEVDGNGRWVGHFHVKDVQRACGLGAQIDKATTEIDYWNRVGIRISDDRKSIAPDPANGSSDNTSPILKVIAQGLGAIAQIVTVGFVPQANVQALDGHQAIEDSLKTMEGFEKDLLKKTPAADASDVAGFTFEFLFTQANFKKSGNQALMVIETKQNPSNLPSEGEACTIHDNLTELQTGERNVGPEGTDYQVKGGDTLLKIAAQSYGNERYFMMIAAANNIPFDRMNNIQKARTIRLEPIGKLRNRSDLALVARRDSIWTIAHKPPNPQDFAKLDAANRSWVANPDLIYPLQMIRTTVKTNSN